MAASEKALEARARRAAQRIGLVARKSRRRASSADNAGGFMLVDPRLNAVACGERYEMSAEEVIRYCQQ